MKLFQSTFFVMLASLVLGAVILPGCGGSGGSNSTIRIVLTQSNANNLALTVSPLSGSASDPGACSDVLGPVWCTRTLSATQKEFTFTTDTQLVPYFVYVTNVTANSITDANLLIQVDGQTVYNFQLNNLPANNVPTQYATVYRNNVTP